MAELCFPSRPHLLLFCLKYINAPYVDKIVSVESTPEEETPGGPLIDIMLFVAIHESCGNLNFQT